MTNIALPSIDDYKDCMAIKNYNNDIKKKPVEEVLPKIQKATRDNARTPVQWSGETYGGFSTTQPWFAVNENYTTINVASQEQDPDSLLNFYRKLIAFRTKSPVVRYGSYRELCPHHKHLYVYEREYEGEGLLVVCSFTDKPCTYHLPKKVREGNAKVLFSNYNCDDLEPTLTTKPYEVRVYQY